MPDKLRRLFAGPIPSAFAGRSAVCLPVHRPIPPASRRPRLFTNPRSPAESRRQTQFGWLQYSDRSGHRTPSEFHNANRWQDGAIERSFLYFFLFYSIKYTICTINSSRRVLANDSDGAVTTRLHVLVGCRRRRPTPSLRPARWCCRRRLRVNRRQLPIECLHSFGQHLAASTFDAARRRIPQALHDGLLFGFDGLQLFANNIVLDFKTRLFYNTQLNTRLTPPSTQSITDALRTHKNKFLPASRSINCCT